MGEILSAGASGAFGDPGTLLADATDGLTGARAAADAKKEMQYGSNRAKSAYNTAYNTQKDLYKPWQDAGQDALTSLKDPNFMKDYQGDPGYQFRMAEGMKAINAGAAARGMGNSGATMKALAKYGQDYSSNEYGNAYNRNYSRLSGLANFGNQATANLANAASSHGSAMAGIDMGHANAMASSGMAQAGRMSDLYQQGIGLGVSAISGMPSMGGGGGGGGAPPSNGFTMPTSGGQGSTGGYLNGSSGGYNYSDARLKTDIESVFKADLDEMKSYLKAYKFKYTSEEFGKGEWVGVMAQDLEKSKLGRTLVVEDEFGRKQIDLKKVMSLFLATMAEA